jgi:hypothetical protein
MSLIVNCLGGGVGNLKENGVFVTRRNETHIFRKFNGLGMSLSVLQNLFSRGCWKITFILERSNGEQELYSCLIEDFLEKGIIYQDKADSQRILPFEMFNQKIIKEFTV